MWLPHLATDRLSRNDPAGRDSPLATIAPGGGAHRVLAVNRAARALGLRPGMTAADAQAMAPALRTVPADPAGDALLLEHWAEWAIRYTPWTCADRWADGIEGGGLWLDITGCAHLFGGEDKLLADLVRRVARCGFAVRAAVADTPGAAWAWTRFGDRASPILPPNTQRAALAGLPVPALRLPPAVAATLVRLGLRVVGEVMAIPRPALAARFGPLVTARLDQALGTVDEPISPKQPPVAHRVHLAFTEPIARTEDVTVATRHLLERLAGRLERERLGVRRLELAAFRLDASAQRLVIGTSRPSRDPRHLLRLLAEPLSGLEAGFGIEMLRLSALEVGEQSAEQAGFVGTSLSDDLAGLLDSLGNRLGFDRMARLVPRQSHLPERAVRRLPPEAVPAAESWSERRRPVRLFARPEPVEAMAPVPDAPPLLFRWRRRTHRVARAEGPERLSAEWWRQDAQDRDYYCVEDEAGRRFWLFREGLYGGAAAPRWFIHGLFP